MLSEAELNEIIDLHYNDIYMFCLAWLGNTEDAQDMTQNVFAVLIEKADKTERSNIKAWLYTVASRKISAYKRKKYNQPETVSIETLKSELSGELNKSCEAINIEDDYELKQLKAELRRTLGNDERTLFDLAFNDNLKCREISEEMGISPNVVYVRLARLKGKLRKKSENFF